MRSLFHQVIGEGSFLGCTYNPEVLSRCLCTWITTTTGAKLACDTDQNYHMWYRPKPSCTANSHNFYVCYFYARIWSMGTVCDLEEILVYELEDYTWRNWKSPACCHLRCQGRWQYDAARHHTQPLLVRTLDLVQSLLPAMERQLYCNQLANMLSLTADQTHCASASLYKSQGETATLQLLYYLLHAPALCCICAQHRDGGTWHYLVEAIICNGDAKLAFSKISDFKRLLIIGTMGFGERGLIFTIWC